MNISFKDCLEKKKIFRFEPARQLVDLELEDAEEDLKSAQREYTEAKFKWATIKGYYSMFHSARRNSSKSQKRYLRKNRRNGGKTHDYQKV